jgi:hypothetical protein
MSDAPHDHNRHRRPHTPPMAAPFLEFDLTRELEQLHGEPEWNSGQNAKTLVKYEDFRVVLTRAQGTRAASRASDKGADLDPDRRRPYPGASGRSDVRSAHRNPARIGPGPAS